MKYLISYKIKDNRRRYYFTNLLRKHGYSVNRSLYECTIRNNEFDEFQSEILKIVNLYDSIRIYPLCKECMKKAVGTENITISPLNKGYIVI